MPSAADAYDYVQVLGRGGFALVELWRERGFNQDLVVAKRIMVDGMTEAEEKACRQEALVLRRLKHPCIVKYKQHWVNRQQGDLIIVQAYCEGGDLAKVIADAGKREEYFPVDRVVRWMAQLSHALQYCHRKWRTLHRDLKPQNVFLKKDLADVFIGDFGIARALGSTKSLCNTFIGTQTYMSPELIRMQQYGLKSDVWGLGMVMYEVCSLKRAFEAKDALTAMQKIVGPEAPPPFPDGASHLAALEPLCVAMLTKQVEDRPTLSELLRGQRLLLDAVVALEAEIGWEESLVPAPDECLGTLAEEALMQQPPPDGDDDSRRPSLMVEPPPPPPKQPPEWASGPNGPPTPAQAQASTAGVSHSPVADPGAVAEDALRHAAEVSDLRELTLRRGEFEALLAQLPDFGPQPPPPPPKPDQAAALNDDEPPLPPPTPLGAQPCLQPITSADLIGNAELIDVRLHCLEVLQDVQPDAIELTLALQRVRKHNLKSEAIGQALLLHAHRLCLSATSTIANSAAPLPEVQHAVELLEALGPDLSQRDAAAAQEALRLGHRRLEQAHGEQQEISLKCVAGAHMRLVAAPRSVGLADAAALVAKRWARPAQGFQLFWRDSGGVVRAIESPEHWADCLRQHPQGIIEIVLPPAKGEAPPAVPPGVRPRRQRKSTRSSPGPSRWR